mgnify:CR=1 FL=1
MNVVANEKWLEKMFSDGMIVTVIVACLVALIVSILTKNLLAAFLTLVAVFTAGLIFTGVIW